MPFCKFIVLKITNFFKFFSVRRLTHSGRVRLGDYGAIKIEFSEHWFLVEAQTNDLIYDSL